jgi:hypothetical protein
MRRLDFGRMTLCSCAAAALLAGCGAAQPLIGAPGSMPQTRAIAAHADRRGSWMLPEAKGEDLLYVTKLRAVHVYQYRKPGRLVGTLAVYAENLCSDNRGNVWLLEGGTDFYASHLVEYAHGGKEPIAKLRDTDGYPSGCAVDPTTGNLAVTNQCENWISSICDGMGSVNIYADAKGHARKYTSPALYHYYYCNYDGHGNLLVNGTINSGYPAFVELLSGRSVLTNIHVNQAFQRAGEIQWYGPYVAIADPNAENIYEFSLGQRKLKKVSTTPIDDGFDGSFVVHGNNVVVSGPDDVAWYNYPGGGSPKRQFRVTYSHSVALSISPPGARTHP